MKFEAMREWSPEERAAKEKEWTQSLFTLRLQKATGQLENPMKIREMRRDLARLKTLANVPMTAATAPRHEAAPAAAEATATAPAKKASAKKAAPKKAAPKKAEKAPARKAAPKAASKGKK